MGSISLMPARGRQASSPRAAAASREDCQEVRVCSNTSSELARPQRSPSWKPSSSPLPIQPPRRPPSHRPPPLATADGVPSAAGLRPLRLLRGQPGREIRIWIGGGFSYPQDLFRFVDRRGQVTGEWVLHWHVSPPDTALGERPGETFHDLMLHSLAGSCTGFRERDGFAICRALYTRPPDWTSVLREAEAAGLWELPDQSLLPNRRMVHDGWGITVELLDGDFYRVYHYSNPDHQEWPEARQAVAIADAMRSMVGVMREPHTLRPYRGVTTGRYKSSFRDCDTGEVWWLYNDLWADAARGGVAVPPAADSTTLLYMELRGVLSPEWLARAWSAPYPRVLEVKEIRQIGLWTGGECGRGG